MLSALARCVTGAPVAVTPTESPSGDPSGEEQETERPSDLLSASPLWDSFIVATELHEKKFEEEFQNQVKHQFLDDYKFPSPQAGCPSLNFSKESCLHRLVQGLLKYQVLLKHVEKEYPRNSMLPDGKLYNLAPLISLIKEKMKHPERVTALTSSQEEQLLKELVNPDTFHRKMTAYNILHQLRLFLIDGKRAVARKEVLRGSLANNLLGSYSVL
ncbi:interleukin-6-like [Centroberyx gerrardi]|uniref:interleukin-6-like n=1 Tax=Centroberyx gerrardi TaxID=166262 RepID=UPI003AAF2C22